MLHPVQPTIATTGPSSSLLLSLLPVLAGCSAGDGSEGSFEQPRTHEATGKPVRWNRSSAERFGVSASDFAPDEPALSGGELTWERPETWIELPPAPHREANFRIPGHERAECYFSTLAGEGGGLAANVNRWRTQMSLEPLTEAEIAALPRTPWLGAEAVLVDFSGTWTGMGGGPPESNWRLVGLLRVEPGRSRFLKLTGPADLLAGEIESFHRLAASFREAPSHAHDDGHEHAQGAEASPGLPPGHPPLEPAARTQGRAAEGLDRSPSGLRWSPQPGWTRGADKAMREITYVVGGSEGGGSECYVTLLSGDGGGLLANLNRWCQQMGQPALDEHGLAGLARVPMLGGSGVFLELARGPAASAAQEHLLGLVLMLEGQALFVKMAGPRALLEREREAFLEFCRSARSVG